MSPALVSQLRPLTIAAGLFVAGGASAWIVRGWQKDAEIQTIKAAYAAEKLEASDAALVEFKKAASDMSAAVSDVQRSGAVLQTTMKTLGAEIKNAKPLPVDCRPDAVRVRSLDGAYSAARTAAIGQ